MGGVSGWSKYLEGVEYPLVAAFELEEQLACSRVRGSGSWGQGWGSGASGQGSGVRGWGLEFRVQGSGEG